MKLRDVFKIALHNLWYNKSRTILTVIIVMVVSTLIMTLCLFGINFMQNQIDVNKDIFNEQGTRYYAYSRYIDNQQSPYTEEEMQHVFSTADEYAHIIDSFEARLESYYYNDQNTNDYVSTSFSVAFGTDADKVYTSSNYNTSMNMWSTRFIRTQMCDYGKENLILQGSIWSATDAGQNKVWLAEDYIKTLVTQGVTLNVGDNVTFMASTWGNKMDSETRVAHDYVLAGIFDAKVLRGEEQYGDTITMLVDLDSFVRDFSDQVSYSEIQMTYAPPQTEYNYNAVYDDMKAFEEKLNAGVAPNRYDSTERDCFTCSYVEDMQMTVLMSAIILAVIVLLSVLILLLSVGSVANTIIISVDKNRKFIGLMKAMGLNQNGVKKIVTCESLMQIAIGVLIAVGALFAIRPLIATILASMFESMFSYFAVEIALSVTVPFYLPIATILLFFLFATLFSRGSLGKIAKQDVISTISEVS